MQREMEEKEKKATDQETERKSAKEFEIKYKKLEGIFDAVRREIDIVKIDSAILNTVIGNSVQERAKMNTERARNKSELTAMKKSADEAEERMSTFIVKIYFAYSLFSNQ